MCTYHEKRKFCVPPTIMVVGGWEVRKGKEGEPVGGVKWPWSWLVGWLVLEGWRCLEKAVPHVQKLVLSKVSV